MELGEPDESGRRRPVPVEGSEFLVDADTVVFALGFGVDDAPSKGCEGLETNKWGEVTIDADDRRHQPPGRLRRRRLRARRRPGRHGHRRRPARRRGHSSLSDGALVETHERSGQAGPFRGKDSKRRWLPWQR